MIVVSLFIFSQLKKYCAFVIAYSCCQQPAGIMAGVVSMLMSVCWCVCVCDFDLDIEPLFKKLIFDSSRNKKEKTDLLKLITIENPLKWTQYTILFEYCIQFPIHSRCNYIRTSHAVPCMI